jgi:hypothetical protein
MADPNVHQQRTAMHFGTHLHMQGVRAEDLDDMPEADLARHAMTAGLGRVPNTAVRSMAKEYMSGLAQPMTDDPFAGL